MNKPLKGFTVLDLGTMTPGKYCSYLLADLGASVIRIERPVVDSLPVDDEDLVLNQGKRSMTLNLRSEVGRDLYLRLAETADVVVESNRPGTADRNGFGFAAVQARNPDIIYCALSGYGATGPQSQAPGYDLIFTAQSGMLKALSGDQAAPVAPDAYLADGVAGLTAAYAILAALLGRQQSSEASNGTFIDLAMHDSIFAMLAVSHGLKKPADHLLAAQFPMPTYTVYPAADNTFVALGAIRASSSRALFEQLGNATLAGRSADPEEVATFLRQAFITKAADGWVAQLSPLDIEIASVNDPRQAFDDPQLIARGMIGHAEHPEQGEIEFIQPPLVAARGTDNTQALGPAPRIGADTQEILHDLGVDDEALSGLREQGIV
jgi:crotonobetainyl-CoA:carnitine CoA-transferase CaiB-like acyl-CoA transferase